MAVATQRSAGFNHVDLQTAQRLKMMVIQDDVCERLVKSISLPMGGVMKPVKTFQVVPALPPRIAGLNDIVYNLRWAWNHDAIELFRRIDRSLWEETGHNPVRMLGSIEQKVYQTLVEDEGFLGHYDRVLQRLRFYEQTDKTWYQKTFPDSAQTKIAYFSAEFGITECLPIYSGGLGLLAGDHLKSASDLALPLVGVGLLYQQGYFRQYLNDDGWQQESYPENDFYTMPIKLENNSDGTPVIVEVEFPNRKVAIRVWKARVGRIQLYLLDTNFDANRKQDQDIVDQLYGGDTETRIKQEMILGIGGIRALKVLGIDPTVCHMNEGHSAFLALERIRALMTENGLSFQEATRMAVSGNVFTTHTPVAAGHDYFEPGLMATYFSNYTKSLQITFDEFLGLGRQNPQDKNELFCMTILAMRLSSHRNGVSLLHGKVSRQMWSGLWPKFNKDDTPISHITNGVHSRSWISKEMAALFERYLGPRWREQPGDQSIWQGIGKIPSVELWQTHKTRRERLIGFARRRLHAQLIQRGGSQSELATAEEVLDPDILTIGFARRFATYKRATLLFRDEARIRTLLCDPERPVQLLFAGKAHPKDDYGKDLIKRIIHFARNEQVRRHIVFLENYDMDVGRYLYQGVDVWLNTPIRPREASGTSGMKAAFNGALNLSVLDGWWDEAYRPELGWAIGHGEIYEDAEQQDEVESKALYNLLEKDVVPTFYDRGMDGVPRRWVAMMKASMGSLCPAFNTDRMVQEYTQKFYMPAVELVEHLSDNDFIRIHKLDSWLDNVRTYWPQVNITKVLANNKEIVNVGDSLHVEAHVKLGKLTPEDIKVELCWGGLDSKGNIINPSVTEMFCTHESKGKYIYTTESAILKNSGQHGYTVRIQPKHEDLVNPVDTGLIVWPLL